MTLTAAWFRGPLRRLLGLPLLPGIVLDEKRERRRLPHLQTERNADSDLVLRRGANGACVHLREAAAWSTSTGLRFAALSIAASSRRWAFEHRGALIGPRIEVRRPRASPAPAAETKCTRKTAAGVPHAVPLGVGKSPARFSARLPGAAFKRALQARHPSPATPRVVLYG